MRAVLIVLLLGAAGCSACGKSKPPPAQTAPDNVESAGSDDLKGDKGHLTKVHGYASDMTVPKGTGAPPAMTTGPLDPAKAQELGELQFPGFKRELRTAEPGQLVIQQTTTSRPQLRAVITIEPCGPAAECTPINLAAWQAKSDALRTAILRKELQAGSDSIFEVAAEAMNGTTVITTYAVGFNGKIDEAGNPAGTYQNAYEANFNDGKNRISVAAEYFDDQPKSIKALVGYAPKGDLQKIAIGFLDFYTQNW